MATPPNSPLLSAWKKTVSRHGDRTAVFDGARRTKTTFSEIQREAREWEGRLPDNLARKVVGLQVENGVEWLACLIALRRKDAVVLPIDSNHTSASVQNILERFRAAGCIGRSGYQARDGKKARAKSGVALVKLTSGSAGPPKGLFFTEPELLADAENIRSTMGLRPADRNYALLPFAHSYALGNLVVPLLAFGIPVCTSSSGFPHVVAEEIAWAECTVFPAIPILLRALTSSTVEHLGPLRLVISAAAPLTPDLAGTFYQRFGITIHNFYGASETGGIAYDRDGKSAFFGDALGMPMNGVTVETTADGRLRVAGAAVSSYRAIKRGAQGHASRVLADRADLLPDGRIALAGRADRVVKCAGRRVDLTAVERHLSACITDGEIHVVHDGDHDRLLGVCTDRRSVKELARHLGCLLPQLRGRLRLSFLAEIPRNLRGKVDRPRLLASLKAATTKL